MAGMTSTAPGRPANLLHAVLVFAVAAAVLILADLLLRLLPFGAIARRIQRTLPDAPSPAEPDLTVRRVKWAVCAARRRLPWIACLATAIAANRLLAWRGIASKLWLGVRPGDEAAIAAHAWLEAEGCVVTGGSEKKTFHPLHALVTSRATP
jgi:hypothetical protein